MKIFNKFKSTRTEGNIRKIFLSREPDEALLRKIEEMAEPRIRYVIAITPRSGSSLLCDVMKNTGALGEPGELLPEEFIPNILVHAPARNPDDYLRNVLKALQGSNGVSGLKASWFQFHAFAEELQHDDVLQQFKYIYLVRRDLFAQAVSLYKAASSSVFHTNVAHGSEALDKLAALEYDFDKINEWYRHIVKQETGWQRFFDRHRIFPLFITYEDIENDVVAVVKRIASYLGVEQEEVKKCSRKSVFRKIGDRSNLEWACRFELELDALKRRSNPRLSDVRY